MLRDAGLPEEEVERASLLVSELVTNAIVHAGSEVCVRVTTEPVPRVEVEDHDPTLPTPTSVPTMEPGGLGLMIVDRLATRWGSERTADGKVVWFELDPGN